MRRLRPRASRSATKQGERGRRALWFSGRRRSWSWSWSRSWDRGYNGLLARTCSRRRGSDSLDRRSYGFLGDCGRGRRRGRSCRWRCCLSGGGRGLSGRSTSSSSSGRRLCCPCHGCRGRGRGRCCLRCFRRSSRRRRSRGCRGSSRGSSSAPAGTGTRRTSGTTSRPPRRLGSRNKGRAANGHRGDLAAHDVGAIDGLLGRGGELGISEKLIIVGPSDSQKCSC